MSSPVSIYAIAELNRRADEATQKVRRELLRIGCPPRQVQVLRQGCYLQVKHQQRIILTDPDEVLRILRKLPVGLGAEEVWKKIHAVAQEQQRRSLWTKGTLYGLSVVLVVALIGLAVRMDALDRVVDIIHSLHLY